MFYDIYNGVVEYNIKNTIPTIQRIFIHMNLLEMFKVSHTMPRHYCNTIISNGKAAGINGIRVGTIDSLR